VSFGDRVVVAARDEPARQLWVTDVADANWARSAGFVVFWANAFDWVGRAEAAGDSFVSYFVGPTDQPWAPVSESPQSRPTSTGDVRDDEVDGKMVLWPGLYRSAEGKLRAFNAPVVTGHVRATAATPSDWRQSLAAVARSGGLELAPWLLTASIACVTAAALAWPKRRVVRRAATPAVEEIGAAV
jgi:hypothetical protein